MLSDLGNETDLLTPHRRYLEDLLNELGIPPWSKLSDSEVRNIIKTDHRLIMAIYNIYNATHILYRINYVSDSSRFKRLQKMKNEVQLALELL